MTQGWTIIAHYIASRHSLFLSCREQNEEENTAKKKLLPSGGAENILPSL